MKALHKRAPASRAWMAGVTVAALVVAACSGSTGATPGAASASPATASAAPAASSAPPPSTAPSQAPNTQLSGELTIYSQVAPHTAENIDKAFNAAYPNVTIKLDQSSKNLVDQVFPVQATHGGSPADVVMGGTPLPFEQNPGILANLRNAGVTGLDSWPKSNQTATYLEAIDGLWGVGYDTTKVTGSEIPKTWQDVLNSAFTGKCATLQIIGKNPGVISWPQNMQKSFGDAYLQKFAALHCQVMDTGQLTGQILASGGVEMAVPVFPSMVNPFAEKGAPVKYVLMTDPLLGGGKYIGINAKAPHMALAAAFISWFITPAGQSAACDSGTYGSPLPNVPGCGAVDSSGMVQPDWTISASTTEAIAKLEGITQ